MKIYLDIETIPTQRPEIQEHVKSNVKAPGNYKDPAKIAAYIENRRVSSEKCGASGGRRATTNPEYRAGKPWKNPKLGF
jgi:hypothetical protein